MMNLTGIQASQVSLEMLRYLKHFIGKICQISIVEFKGFLPNLEAKIEFKIVRRLESIYQYSDWIKRDELLIGKF